MMPASSDDELGNLSDPGLVDELGRVRTELGATKAEDPEYARVRAMYERLSAEVDKRARVRVRRLLLS